jgi:hypothetical protein
MSDGPNTHVLSAGNSSSRTMLTARLDNNPHNKQSSLYLRTQSIRARRGKLQSYKNTDFDERVIRVIARLAAAELYTGYYPGASQSSSSDDHLNG